MDPIGIATVALLTMTDGERDHLRGFARRSDDLRIIHLALALLCGLGLITGNTGPFQRILHLSYPLKLTD